MTTVGAFVSSLAASPSSPSVIYAGFTDGTVQVSTDSGLTFTALALEPFNEHFVTGIAVDPADPKRITASFSYSDTRNEGGFPHVAQYAYATTPGSGAWTAITGSLPATAAVSRVVYDNGALVAATDVGVYATAAAAGSSTAWSRVGSGLPMVQVQDLDVEADGLYAVTHGRGAWKLPPLDEVPTASPTVPARPTPPGTPSPSAAAAAPAEGVRAGWPARWAPASRGAGHGGGSPWRAGQPARRPSRSTASVRRSSGVVREIRKNPSPLGP